MNESLRGFACVLGSAVIPAHPRPTRASSVRPMCSSGHAGQQKTRWPALRLRFHRLSILWSRPLFRCRSRACWVVVVAFFVLSGRLKYPACKKRLEPAVGAYCPQCGSDRFQYSGHKRKPSYCPSCDSQIAEDDGDSSRSYRIRGCTHCGVMLYEKGL